MSKAMVVLSGGQDSATCAAWAKMVFDDIAFITFDYGQRHKREIESAKAIAKLLGGDHHLISVPALQNNPTSALTSDVDVCETDKESGLPKTFVPGRNLVFLTQAASVAISHGYFDLVTGVCQTDFSGYPDCRRTTIDALEEAIFLGNENLCPKGFQIHTPLMYLTKAETVLLAKRLVFGWEALRLSWTCYKGGDKPCAVCPACQLRIKGFAEAGYYDPALS